MTSRRPFRPDISPELQRRLDIIATQRERPVLFIVGELTKPFTDGLVLYMSKYSWGEFIKHNGLSVLIHSPGGDPKETYRMMLILRLYVNDIEVLVPQEAKSAATLLCLGANKILMGSKGELGPLDMQLVSEDESRRSALESFKASEQMLDHTMLAFQKIIDDSLNNMSQANRQSYRLRNNANMLMSSIVSNLYQNFDPDELGRDSRYLSVGEEYARRLLGRVKYEESMITAIAHRLVWDYPSHDFLIDWREAEEIGLNVEYLDDTVSQNYEWVLSQMCEDSLFFEDYDDIVHQRGTIFEFGIPEENDEQVGVTDGSGDKGDDDATEE